jgi:ADP-ribose pyrophosphatase
LKKEIKKWKIVSSKILLDNERLSITEDTVELPDGRLTTYVKHTPSSLESVIIIAVNAKNQVLIQREYSHPPQKVMWQLPGGSMEKGETIEQAALRELAEESGYSAKLTKYLGNYYVHNRLSDKRQHIVLCTELFEYKLPEDDDEYIENNWMSKGTN